MTAAVAFPQARTARPSARPLNTTEMLIAALLMAGLGAAWLAEVLPVEKAMTLLDTEGKFVILPLKSALYYAAHAVAIGTMLSAGLLGGLQKRFRSISPEGKLALAGLFFTSVTWAAIAYRPEELFSATIVGATGPIVWFVPIIVFAGANRRLWPYLDRTVRVLTYLTTAMALRALASPYIYYRGFSKYILYATLLFWLGGWTLLTGAHLKGRRLLPRLIPYVLMLAMALCSQSRSWTLLGLILGAAFIYLKGREQGSFVLALRAAIVLATGSVLTVVLIAILAPQTLNRSVEGFRNRLKEDSRTGQYTAFFAAVPPSDLLLGRGPKGTWYWRGFGDFQFFDNGFLWTLFIGGVPTLVGYVIVMFWPAIKVLRYKPRGVDAAAVSMVLLATLSMTGLSTFTLPTVGLPSYLWALFAGRCYLALAEHSRKGIRFERQSAQRKQGAFFADKRWKEIESAAWGGLRGNL